MKQSIQDMLIRLMSLGVNKPLLTWMFGNHMMCFNIIINCVSNVYILSYRWQNDRALFQEIKNCTHRF